MANLTKQVDYGITLINYFLKITIIILIIYTFFIKVTV